MVPASRASALAALLFGAVALGFTPIFVRLTETGPAAAGFWRLLLALPLLGLLTFRKGAPAGGPSWIMALAGVFFALDLAFWHYGIALTSVMNATVLCNLTPIAVTIAGWWLFRERPARAFVVGMVLGIAGAITVAMSRSAGPAIGANPPLGDLLSLLTTLWYAGYFLCVRAARDTRGAAVIMFWSSLVGTAALAAAMLALGEDVFPEGLGGWGACLGLALVHVAGQGAIAWALGRLPAATASVVVLIQPVVAAALGWMLFAEAVNGMQAAGAALALVGVAIAQWAGARNENGRRSPQEPAPTIS
ncbi:MAG TPA: EamA family transporter [Caulobacteraceae bacterium]|nr:EamA family transporter [Caulobacteraceae bacterium]